MNARQQLLTSKLYGFTPDKYLKNRKILDVVEMQLKAGIDIIQLREKNMSDKEKYSLALEIKKLTLKYGKLFIVNDDPAIAKFSGADGVHIGQDDLDAKLCRELLGEDKIIGLSTHNESQYIEGQNGCADYTAIGPVFATSTKENPAPVVSIEKIPELLKFKKKFTAAIGGINSKNIGLFAGLNVDCFAVVSDIVCSENISGSVKTLKKIIGDFK